MDDMSETEVPLTSCTHEPKVKACTTMVHDQRVTVMACEACKKEIEASMRGNTPVSMSVSYTSLSDMTDDETVGVELFKVPCVETQEGMYTLTYIGMDRNDHEEEHGCADEALKAKRFIEERGGHSISIYDPDGNQIWPISDHYLLNNK